MKLGAFSKDMPIKRLLCSTLLMIMELVAVHSAAAQQMPHEKLIQELIDLSQRAYRIDKSWEKVSLHEDTAVIEKDRESELLQTDNHQSKGIKSVLEQITEKVEISGAVEVEAVYDRLEPEDEEKEITQDLTLSTVELAMDSHLTERITAHVIFDYAESDGVDVDEAFIHYQTNEDREANSDNTPLWYTSLGRMTLPFGNFKNHFISDAPTQELGETKETALLIGFHPGFTNWVVGLFDGDIETDGNKYSGNYVATGRFTMPEEFMPDLEATGGISFISTLTDSDELTQFWREEFASDTVTDRVAGIGTFLSIIYGEHLFFEAEYIAALDRFAVAETFKPQSWNVELALRLLETVKVGWRYAGSRNTLNFLPKIQVGMVTIYKLFPNTFLGLEYLYEKYAEKEEATRVTSRITVEF